MSQRCFGLKKEYNRNHCYGVKEWHSFRCEEVAVFSTYTMGTKIFFCQRCSDRGFRGLAPFLEKNNNIFMSYGLDTHVPLQEDHPADLVFKVFDEDTRHCLDAVANKYMKKRR